MSEKSGTPMQIKAIQDVKDILKNLSSKDFLNFGIQDVAYIKQIDVDGQEAYAAHGADGSALFVVESNETAEELLGDNNLEKVTIH